MKRRLIIEEYNLSNNKMIHKFIHSYSQQYNIVYDTMNNTCFVTTRLYSKPETYIDNEA